MLMPSSIIGPILAEKPPNRANRIGTRISAIKADRRLVMIRYMKVMTMAKPRKVSMAILQAWRGERNVDSGGSARSALCGEHAEGGYGKSGTGIHQNHHCCC
ncbi:hypothetical protein D3C72_1569870 [compost metagenome]